ncbi:hypothetical protein BHE74_00044213 [Ensete ventricosum]|nr:hypothetical protein BHE74_00044213 [Ensete ventricosum]
MLLFRCVFRDAPVRMCISGCSCLDICLEMLLLEGSHGIMHKGEGQISDLFVDTYWCARYLTMLVERQAKVVSLPEAMV